MVKIILAANPREAQNWCVENLKDIMTADRVVVVRSSRTLEGLRFRYEDVIRVPGWSKNPDIELIEERILLTHITSKETK